MAEKRNNKRVRVNMKVDYRDDTHNDKMGLVVDISKSGMYVQTGYAPEVKGYVMASLDAEDFGKVIWVEGCVVWRSRTGMAVTFTNTDAKGLNNLLTSRSAPF
jgi:ribosomal protein L18